ncbi:unnamed protein product [Polarella glacialis]|uniref:ABC1 atypical kinase-like domain-containing protein n=1 Tax=Polarella glacialis TaxID=89957 RepID=A0A813JGX3_POLGL|nr:unnamed protein product [Polarella glacialis]
MGAVMGSTLCPAASPLPAPGPGGVTMDLSFSAAKRAAGHLSMLLAVAAVLPGCLALDVQAWALRQLLFGHRRSEGRKSASASSAATWADHLVSAAEEAAWLSWLWSAVIARLRRDVPLTTLLARWVAVKRPDLALSSGPFARLVALLRDQESGGVVSSPSFWPRHYTQHDILEQLEEACGPEWQQALQIDLQPTGADCILQVYRAVLREQVLERSQRCLVEEAKLHKYSILAPLAKLIWFPRWHRRSMQASAESSAIAQAVEARGALVRARRPDVAHVVKADLLIARFFIQVASLVGASGPSTQSAFCDFCDFVSAQLDLRQEARLLELARAALTSSQVNGVVLPRPVGRPTEEVVLVSFEEGVCLAEVLRRPFDASESMEQTDISARAAAAHQLALAFWSALLRHGLLLGGLCAGNILLRDSICDSTPLEVVILRCGLSREVSSAMCDDLRGFAAILQTGASKAIGDLLLERVHAQAGGSPEQVLDPEGFREAIEALLQAASVSGRRGSSCASPGQPLRGARLLQRALGILQAHGLRASPAHLQVAAAAAAAHAVCSRLDPVGGGGFSNALLQVAKAESLEKDERHVMSANGTLKGRDATGTIVRG